jgi:hypothetical protein
MTTSPETKGELEKWPSRPFLQVAKRKSDFRFGSFSSSYLLRKWRGIPTPHGQPE